ncbi:MAG TPA: Gfo/Idh/MocA family oxidoreductase [Terracidiphilus sp.]|nr:Gfo/Idh/MocA family oxidoreductase [Terracidiphilus sp.]
MKEPKATAGEAMLKVAVAGAGAFGRNHLRIYHEMEAAGEGVALAAVVEPDAGRAAVVEEKYAIPVFATVEALLAADLRLDAASVAVPTVHHANVATQLLEAGLDLLVEKPLAATLAEADALVALAEKKKKILQPGHLERFNPAVLAVQPKLRRPMFFEAHRLSVFTPRALDVDVVLDLMIHDLDIVLTFAASAVREVRAVGLPILSPRVDIANVRVEFESGCVANFTASRVSTERVRKLRFFEPRQYVSIDYARQDLLVIRLEGGVPAEIAAALAAGRVDPALLAQLAESAGGAGDGAASGSASGYASGPGPGLKFAKLPVTPGEPLRLEIAAFLDAVRTRRAPRVTARQGREALALALAIQAEMAAHAERAGLKDFFESGMEAGA